MSTRHTAEPPLPGLAAPPVPVTVRIPHEVHEHLLRRSHEARRNKTQQIIWLIEEDAKRAEAERGGGAS